MPELKWEGKYDENHRIVGPPRVSLPFQTVETVNQSAQERQLTLGAAPTNASSEWRNRLIWGDKKYVLPSLLDEFAGKVDLIYIDPPFATGDDFTFTTAIHPVGDDIRNMGGGGRRRNPSSKVDYQPNLIEQIAYRDTWGGGLDSYLKWMYETLTLLRELLAESGSIYVHCDDTASHYIKAALDEVFGAYSFRNEIVWRRVLGGKNDAQQYGRSSDRILFATKSEQYIFNPPRLSEVNDSWYNKIDNRGRYVSRPLTASGATRGDSGQPWRNIPPTGHWIVPELLADRYRNETGNTLSGTVRQRLDSLANAGYIEFSDSGLPSWRRYLDEANPPRAQDMWHDDDVKPIGRTSLERTNYPTQKPEALLERIITASSNEGDLVLDCFVGSGTTAVVAEKLGRRWIAADMGRFAISLARKRLLGIDNVKPFYVQNLGRYERQAWQSADLEQDYRQFILQLYRAESLPGYQWLHGNKNGRRVHVGAVDAPVTLDDVQRVIEEFRASVGTGANAPTTAGVDILGWDFGLETDTDARALGEAAGVNVRLLRIPREVMDQKAVDAGDIRFFELAALDVASRVNRRDRRLTLTLRDFAMPLDGVPDQVREAVTHWSQWIDYWAVDWDYRNDTFNNQWQSYRTRAEPQLQRDIYHTYDESGRYTVVIKVIDILGNDTTRRLEVEI